MTWIPLPPSYLPLYTSPDCRIASLFSFLVRTTTGCQIVNHTKVVTNYNSNNDSQDSLTPSLSVGDDDFGDAFIVSQTYGEPRVILRLRQTTLVLSDPSFSVHSPLWDTPRAAVTAHGHWRHVGRLPQRQVHVGHCNTWERKYICLRISTQNLK